MTASGRAQGAGGRAEPPRPTDGGAASSSNSANGHGRARRFEDLEAWQKAAELHQQLQLVLQGPQFTRAYKLKDQIEGAATSAMGNIAEGYERDGSREFAHALSIAKGSAGEVRSHLYAARDAGYLSRDQFDHLLPLCLQTSRLIASLRAAVVRSINTTARQR